jgi:uncharacterized protein (TIGR02996 family)
VRAWLERAEPAGDDITLPEGSAALVFGRSPRCTLVFDAPDVSQRHCEVWWEAGFWRVRDLGSDAGTLVNGVPVRQARALFPNDELRLGSVRLRYRSDLPGDDPSLLAALSASPDDEAAWLVYADHLQELGDPLGERITRARAGGRLDHLPWLGPLWESFVNGELEVEWQWGFIKRATVRVVAGRLPLDWRATASLLMSLRIGRLLRSLIIDLPRLEGLTTFRIPEAVIEAQRVLATLPTLPATLERVAFGYHVAQPSFGPLTATEELAARLPRLRGTPVYQRVSGVRLRALQVADGVRLSGLDGTRVLTGVTRLRRGQRGQLFIESPPGIPFMADGNPCYFAFHDGRAQLIAGRMRGEVRVNNRIDSMYELLPDDVIDVQGAARLRLETVP